MGELRPPGQPANVMSGRALGGGKGCASPQGVRSVGWASIRASVSGRGCFRPCLPAPSLSRLACGLIVRTGAFPKTGPISGTSGSGLASWGTQFLNKLSSPRSSQGRLDKPWPLTLCGVRPPLPGWPLHRPLLHDLSLLGRGQSGPIIPSCAHRLEVVFQTCRMLSELESEPALLILPSPCFSFCCWLTWLPVPTRLHIWIEPHY